MAFPVDQFVLFGDSLTERSFLVDRNGWGLQLCQAYIRKVDIINRGYGGYNTDWCIQILPRILHSAAKSATKIKLFTIFLGANDATIPEAKHHVPLKQYEVNLKAMVQMVRSADPETRIVLLTPPPLDDAAWKAFREAQGESLDRGMQTTKVYRDVCLEVAKSENVVCLDTWPVFLDAYLTPGPEFAGLFDDGLHFSASGNQRLFDALFALIGASWPDLRPENMPHILPFWRDVDTSNVEKSLFGKWEL